MCYFSLADLADFFSHRLKGLKICDTILAVANFYRGNLILIYVSMCLRSFLN